MWNSSDFRSNHSKNWETNIAPMNMIEFIATEELAAALFVDGLVGAGLDGALVGFVALEMV